MAESEVANPGSAQNEAPLFLSSGSISCSVCLELVTNAGERSIAKLKCGHHFHLDCIGSAFNAKGLMQCPNCRCVEEGQWLYSNSCQWFEDHMVDESYEDDYDIYTGVADVFHRPEEMDLNLQHWGSYPSFLQQHASLSLESNPSSSSYSNIMEYWHHDEHRALSNQVHRCPYLTARRIMHPGQLQVINDNYGASELHEMAIQMATGGHVGETSARASSVSVSGRNVWSVHGTAPLASLHSGINTDHAEPSNLRHQQLRRSRQASRNRVPRSYGFAFGQFGEARLHPRLYANNAPNMANLSHNQVFRDAASSTRRVVSPVIRHGLSGIRRRLRVRNYQLALPNVQSPEFFYNMELHTPWNAAPTLDPIRVSEMNDAGGHGGIEGFLRQRNENHGYMWGG